MSEQPTCKNGHPDTADNRNAMGRCRLCQREHQKRYDDAQRQRVRDERAELETLRERDIYRREAFQVVGDALTAAMGTRSEQSRGKVLAELANLADSLSKVEFDRSASGRSIFVLSALVVEARTVGLDE